MDKNEDLQKAQLNALANPEMMVPRLATSINFSKTVNGGIIMTVFSGSPINPNPILVNTHYLEPQHAKEIVDVLSKVINDN